MNRRRLTRAVAVVAFTVAGLTAGAGAASADQYTGNVWGTHPSYWSRVLPYWHSWDGWPGQNVPGTR